MLMEARRAVPFVQREISVLSAHMGVMSTLNALGSGISHLLLRPHGDVSHLGGAATTRTHIRTQKEGKKNQVKVYHGVIVAG